MYNDELDDIFSQKSAIDSFLQDTESRHASVRKVLTSDRSDDIDLTQKPGSRVAFRTTLRSLLTYDDAPAQGLEGTVVLVKTAMGKTTNYEDRLFILWDDGKFRSIRAEHLKKASKAFKQANSYRMVVGNMMDLSSMFVTAGGDELIHKATKDLWSFHQENGQYVIDRLFDDNGKPVKV
jgi:hypothetical protein